MPKVVIDGVEYVPKVELPEVTEGDLTECLRLLVDIQYFSSEKHKHQAWAWDALSHLAPDLAKLCSDNPGAAFDLLNKVNDLDG